MGDHRARPREAPGPEPLEAWRRRYQSPMDDPRNHLATIFRNHGPRAGILRDAEPADVVA